MRKLHVISFLLFLSAALTFQAFAQEGEIAFIGLHGGIFDALKEFEEELDVKLDYLTDEMIASGKLDLSRYRVILLQHLRRDARDIYRDLFTAAKEKNPELRILAISRRGAESRLGDLVRKGVIEYDPEVRKYYGSSKENLRRLLTYVLAKYMGRDIEIEPPEEVVEEGLYHPDHDGFFEDVQGFLRWARRKGWDVENAPRAIIAVHSTHLFFQQPKVVDALIREFERQGVLAVAMIDLRGRYESMALEFKPNVVVHTCHSREEIPFRGKLRVPHLHSIFFRKQSIDEWRDSIKGIDPGAVALHITSQEIIGGIEPQVTCGTLRGGGSEEAFTPIPERIEHLVKRALSWIELQRKGNSEKRIAIIYYDRELGKSKLMRGSATGMFLNGPRSLINLLRRMKEAGYSIKQIPQDEDELIGWMMKRGRQIEMWALGELERLVREEDPVLVPAEAYLRWFERRVPEDLREKVIERWGPPPGRFLVWENERGDRFIVIPRIDLGNVILMPQPLRGEAYDISSINTLTHDKLVPPPHNYLATYFWLEEGFKADALIHFGTHGSEFFLPGKDVGLSDRDWPDIIIGGMPNINPWILDNLGEALPAKRRVYALLTDHLTPPLVNAGLSDELLNIQNDITKWETLEDGALREKFRTTITEAVRRSKLDKDLHLELKGDRLLTPEEIRKVSEYLHRIQNETTPVSLHVLGEPPREDLLIPYLVSCLRKGFLDELAKVIPVPKEKEGYLRRKAEEAVRLVLGGMAPLEAIRAIGGKVGEAGLPEKIEKGFKLAVQLNSDFARTPQEIDNILKALEGRFVPPGPGNSPARNPAAVPTGRNMYAFNPEEVPSRSSWEIGKALVDQLLRKWLREKGRYPDKVGFTICAHNTFSDYGVMEAQILYLLGVEPVWDERNLVVDVKLIPKERLKRPRIDVFIALQSFYRDNLPSRMRLLDKAFRLIASLKEEDNRVYENTARVKRELERRGIPKEKAAKLASARMFGVPAGQYGSAGYYYLVERTGAWDTREDLIKVYLSQVKNVYTEGMWGEPAPEAYDELIQGTEIVLRNWSRHMTSPLTNKYFWYRGGSLSLAIKYLTGKEPEFYISDVRNPDNARMVAAEDALRQEYRVRLFNRKWIEGMMKEGYAGADQIAVMVSNTMGWKIMREKSISDDIWEEIVAVYVDDKYNLSIREWFEAENPFAFQEMTEILVEAIRKGYWKADEETRRKLVQLYARSVVRHGESGGVRGGGNVKLERFVREQLEAPGDKKLKELAGRYVSKVKEMAAVGRRETVMGMKLERKNEVVERRKEVESERGLNIIILIPMLLLFVSLLGFITHRLRRKRWV
jgi:cobaltochelatase CobN